MWSRLALLLGFARRRDFDAAGGGRRWEGGGTGRYDGIAGAGTWTAIPATGPRKFVTTWEGEWSLAGPDR